MQTLRFLHGVVLACACCVPVGAQSNAGKQPLPHRAQVVVVQEGLNRVLVFDKARPADRALVPTGEKPHEIAISRDGRTAYVSNFGLLEADHKVGTAGTTISVVDLVHRREQTRLVLPGLARAPHGLKLRPKHEELFTNTEEGVEEMVVFDTRKARLLRSFPLPRGVHNFVFNDAGTELYAFTLTDSVLKLDPQDGRILAQAMVPRVRGLAWTTDHAHLLAGGRGQLFVLNPNDLATERTFGQLSAGQIFYPSASPDGRTYFLPAVLDGVLLVVSAETGEVFKRIETGSPLQVQFEDGFAWVSNVKVPLSMGVGERAGGLQRLSLATYEPEKIADTEDANGIAVVP